MGDIYRDGLIVEKNIPEAIKWYKKAADEGDAHAKTELLKLKMEANAQKKAQAEPAPAGKGDARAGAAVQPATAAAEKPREKVEEKPAKAVEKADLPARGKLQPAQPPKSAKPRTGKKIPEKTVQKPAPKQAGKAHASRKMPVVFAAIGMIAVSLAVVFIGFGNKAEPILESLELTAAEITDLPRPDPRSVPPLAPAPCSPRRGRSSCAEATATRSARSRSSR